MPYFLVRNDIVKMKTDVIVNASNPDPVVGSGVDTAIHNAAGPELLEARKKFGRLYPGQCVITEGFNLPAKYVIHAVGPAYANGTYHEEETLASCYRNAMDLALEYKAESIAFPLLSAGNYGFPADLALKIAVHTVSAYLLEHDLTVYIVVFGRKEYSLSQKISGSVESEIDDDYAKAARMEEYPGGKDTLSVERRRRQAYVNSLSYKGAAPGAFASVSDAVPAGLIDKFLKEKKAGFSETLLKLIDRTGKKDSEVYSAANVDRKLFSKIRSNPAYHPKKETALAFAFALKLNLEETKNLLGTAGYALTRSSEADIIAEYYIVHKYYKIDELNIELFNRGLPGLGGRS